MFGVVRGVVGAIMVFAINVHTHGFNINTAGWILLVVGIVVLLIGIAVFVTGSRRSSTTVENVQRVWATSFTRAFTAQNPHLEAATPRSRRDWTVALRCSTSVSVGSKWSNRRGDESEDPRAV